MPRARKTKASAPPVIAATNLTGWKTKSAVLGAVAVALALAVLAARTGEQEGARAGRPEAADGKRWQTVAPGRVEPASGTIKIAAPVMGVIAQVLIKVDETKVFAGEPLVRLVDTEARARLAAAEAQVAFRLRARNDESAPAASAARPSRPATPRRGGVVAGEVAKAGARGRRGGAVGQAGQTV